MFWKSSGKRPKIIQKLIIFTQWSYHVHKFTSNKIFLWCFVSFTLLFTLNIDACPWKAFLKELRKELSDKKSPEWVYWPLNNRLFWISKEVGGPWLLCWKLWGQRSLIKYIFMEVPGGWGLHKKPSMGEREFPGSTLTCQL